MTPEAVTASYARWAPIYDRTFGAATKAGRRAAVAHLNRRGGHVLEVGVGTGLALPLYDPTVRVTGIDYSAEMLAKAQEKVAGLGLENVTLQRMDARSLDFPDHSFDGVAAMHILSVVPEPERVMAEIARVLKPGGHVVVTNHFARQRGVLAWIERVAAPLENLLGWHSDFDKARILGEPSLVVEEERALPPAGMMTFLALRKAA
jgi:phosphatidylethanolamine/phosphatidyl-N-methylethanolamine N-methyltransferase